MAVGYLYERLRGVWRTRGPMGFFRFLFSRFFRTDRDLLFDRDLVGGQDSNAPDLQLGTLTTIDCQSLDHGEIRELVDRVLTDENRHYADGLSRRDMMLVVTADDGAVLHYSCVQFESRYKTVLGEDIQTPLFTHCWTSPEARGRHLYPDVLAFGGKLLASKGYSRAVITCHPDNIASIKGIERAGFKKRRSITSYIFLSRFALQKNQKAEGPTKWRALVL